MDILKAVNLYKVYGQGETRVEALKDINLSVKEGEFVAIVGPSGSGKSTLLHLLGGLDRPNDGKVIIDGQDIYKLPESRLSVFRRRKLGFIFQFYNLIPVLTVEENIALPLLLDNKDVDEKCINEIITVLGLSERRKHLPNELSGGQQQRVSIGRALVYKPSVIFADEPTGNLDSKNRREVLDLIRISVKKYNQTLIMITHDLEIASTADRIIHIEDGTIVSDKVVRM